MLNELDLHYRLNEACDSICVEAHDKYGPIEAWFSLASKAGQMYLELAKADPRFASDMEAA